MFHLVRPTVQLVLIFSIVFGGAVACCTNTAHAQGNVVMALDGMIVNNSGGGQPNWGGYGRFSYPATAGPTIGASARPGIGRYDAFTLSHTADSGSGVGVNYTIGDIDSPVDSSIPNGISPVTSGMFPLLDLATFGANFDPTQYAAELVYRPLEGNTATQLNMTLDTVDGFKPDGSRSGEQWQWGFFDLINTFNNTQTNGDLDAQGFAVARSNNPDMTGSISQANANFTGQSFMYGAGNPTGDAAADFNDFEGDPLMVPNGAVQIHLQTVFGGAAQTLIDNWEIKALRIVKLAPNPQEVARLDGKSGFSQRFNSPFTRNFDGFINVNGVDYDPPITNQLQRFDETGFLPNNAFRINTDDDDAVGGFGVWQSGVSTVFDGTTASLEIRAKLTAPLAGQAPSVQVVAKDRDGNGTADVGDFGGEEYHFDVALNQFSEGAMTTISIPFTAATIEQAQEFATAGDGLLTNFNLYYLGMLTNMDAGLVDLEVEYVRIMLPATVLAGDYNDNGIVDAADYTVWRDNLGAADETSLNGNGDGVNGVDAGDYTRWKNNFGAGPGAGGVGGTAVPEPSAATLVALGLALFGVRRKNT